ncbi:MAG: HAD family hydrolase, partial [Rickettsiales bacterium]|nr:HAD family hydrolase [Rickettsiales bacterium]
EAAQIYQTAYRAIHLTNLEALEHAEEILKALKPTDIFIAAVSNKKGDNLRKEISHLGWDHYFDAIVGAGDAHADKPDPAPVMLALKETDIQPQECWFVGDTTIDLECAQNVGCIPVLYGEVQTDGDAYDGFPIAHHSRDHHGFMEVIEYILRADAA